MRKRSVVIAGHRTSVSLENVFWDALKVIAEQRGLTVNQLVTSIDQQRNGNLSSAIRVHVLMAFADWLSTSKTAETAHQRPGP